MRTLVLLRHSKAEPHRGDDHGRQLAERGRRDAGAVRDWLVGQELAPELAVVSTSLRTRETWELADPGSTATSYDGRVYEASVTELREVIGETSQDVRSLVVVGHNPSIEALAWELDDSPLAREQTDRGLATSGVAVFDVPAWDLVGARLRSFRG